MTFIMDSVKKGTIKVPWLAFKKLKVLESLFGTLEFSMSPQLNTRVLHCTKDQHDIRRVSRLVAPKPSGEILKMYSPLRRKKWMPFLSLKGGSLFFRPRGEYIFRDVILTDRKMEVTSLSWPMGAMSIHGLDRMSLGDIWWMLLESRSGPRSGRFPRRFTNFFRM